MVKRFVSHKKLLLIIITIGAVVRLLNPFFAHSMLYVIGDEPPNYMGALYVLANKSLLVRTAIYPPFGSYIQVPFLLVTFLAMLIMGFTSSIDELRLLVLTQPAFFLFVPRILAGIFSTLTIIIFYKIIRLILPSKKIVALLGCVFLAFSFNHIQISHFGRPWSAALFFFTLSMFFSLKSAYKKTHELRYVICASLLIIITYGFHQIGVFAIWFFILARLFYQSPILKEELRNKKTWLGLVLISIGICLIFLLQRGNPTADWFPVPTILPNTYPLLIRLRTFILSSSFVYNLKQLITLEPIIFIFFVFFPLFTRYRKTKKLQAIIIFTYTTFIALAVSFQQPRYLLPVILPMCLFASLSLERVLQLIKIKLLKLFIILITLFISTFNPLLWNWLYLKPSTADLAVDWIENNVGPEKTILSTSHRWIPFSPAKEVLPIQQQKNPQFFLHLGKELQLYEYPKNVRNIIYLGEVIDLQHLEEVNTNISNLDVPYRYIIDMYFDPNRSLAKFLDMTKHRTVIRFSPLKNKQNAFLLGNILATVDSTPLPLLMLKLERTGPYIDIYERI